MSQKLIVAKFGGTSMADATAMRRSAEIVKKQQASLVVVSATSGTTNRLIDLASLAYKSSWHDCEKVLTEIQERHRNIARDIEAPSKVFEQIDLLVNEAETIAKGVHYLRDLSLKAMDRIYSIGERLSSTLFTCVLGQVWADREVQFLDVRTVMRTNDRFGKAEPLVEQIKDLARENLAIPLSTKVALVTQGFIGATAEGDTTTLGRGGSDYSASLLGEAIGASEIQIWTDVAGIATTDPRICPNAKPINEITFKEASELAVFGAKVLHPTTLLPAMRSHIPVFVGSSYEPDAPGTVIKKSEDCQNKPLVRAMAMRKDQSLITLSTPKMLHAHGFLYQIFKLFNDHKVSIDAITTSEISVSLTVDDATLLNHRLISDLKQFAEVKIEEDLALVSLIGNKIQETPGLAAEIFNGLGQINVRMICMGASKHNFCFLVKEADAPSAIKQLHQRFIECTPS